MCTALSFSYGDHYFGRNLDLEYGYAEQVVVTPQNYPFPFRHMPVLVHHYAMIGMATVSHNYPLYYEATNEKGLSMAALNFPRFGKYAPKVAEKDNVASFELIPWVLGQCDGLSQARRLLDRLNLTADAFSSQFPPQSLHWILADRYSCLVIEPLVDGLHFYENPIGVLTNAPPFPYHMQRLADFQSLSVSRPLYQNNISSVGTYSGGMGAIGLPGDYSSNSRFIKAAFGVYNSLSDGTESSNVNQFFRILQSVAMPRGCVLAENRDPILTRYSCCCNTDKGIYYYTTYENCRITAIELKNHPRSSRELTAYCLQTQPDFLWEN